MCGSGPWRCWPVRAMLRFFSALIFFAVVIFLFMVGFPYFRDMERMNGQMAAKNSGGEFIQLADKTNIHYVQKGDKGPNLILIHGFCSSVYTWKDVMEPLARDMRVYALDMMGFGFSDKPEKAEYSYGSFAKVVREFMDKKGIQTATIAGNSMGGGITVKFASMFPERTERIILVDSAGYAHKRVKGLNLLSKPVLGKFLFSLNSPTAMRFILQQTSFHNDNRVTPERAQAYFQPFRTAGAAMAAGRAMESISTNSLEEDIKKINKPTLIIWGKNDVLIPFEYAKKFESDIKGSKLMAIPNCGHLSEEEKPDEVVAAIRDFVLPQEAVGGEESAEEDSGVQPVEGAPLQ